jgi:hypothetical protein
MYNDYYEAKVVTKVVEEHSVITEDVRYPRKVSVHNIVGGVQIVVLLFVRFTDLTLKIDATDVSGSLLSMCKKARGPNVKICHCRNGYFHEKNI